MASHNNKPLLIKAEASRERGKSNPGGGVPINSVSGSTNEQNKSSSTLDSVDSNQPLSDTLTSRPVDSFFMMAFVGVSSSCFTPVFHNKPLLIKAASSRERGKPKSGGGVQINSVSGSRGLSFESTNKQHKSSSTSSSLDSVDSNQPLSDTLTTDHVFKVDSVRKIS